MVEITNITTSKKITFNRLFEMTYFPIDYNECEAKEILIEKLFKKGYVPANVRFMDISTNVKIKCAYCLGAYARSEKEARSWGYREDLPFQKN